MKIVAIDWGAPFAPKRPKPHVAAVKSSETKIVKFGHVQELIEEVEPPALVFAESSGPYLDFCGLCDAYGGGSVFAVGARLTAEYRRANGMPKSDEDDARAILRIGEDYLAGKLASGVWPFRPDPLKRTLREADRLFRCYQKLLRLDPEMAEEYERRRKSKIKEVEALAKKDEDCQELVEYLNGFGERGVSVATAIAELRGKRFSNFERLYQYARKNRRLWKAASALAEMVVRNKGRSEKARGVIEQLEEDARRSGRGYGVNLKNRLKKWVLVRAAWAAGALPRR